MTAFAAQIREAHAAGVRMAEADAAYVRLSEPDLADLLHPKTARLRHRDPDDFWEEDLRDLAERGEFPPLTAAEVAA